MSGVPFLPQGGQEEVQGVVLRRECVFFPRGLFETGGRENTVLTWEQADLRQ